MFAREKFYFLKTHIAGPKRKILENLITSHGYSILTAGGEVLANFDHQANVIVDEIPSKDHLPQLITNMNAKNFDVSVFSDQS